MTKGRLGLFYLSNKTTYIKEPALTASFLLVYPVSMFIIWIFPYLVPIIIKVGFSFIDFNEHGKEELIILFYKFTVYSKLFYLIKLLLFWIFSKRLSNCPSRLKLSYCCRLSKSCRPLLNYSHLNLKLFRTFCSHICLSSCRNFQKQYFSHHLGRLLMSLQQCGLLSYSLLSKFLCPIRW